MLEIFDYDRTKAVDYAHKWVFGRNPAFYDFSPIGGDCTNFASQVIFAGTGIMNYTPVYGWFYINTNDRSASWTGVQYLYNFITTNKGVGPFGAEVPLYQAEPGDIIQLAIDKDIFHHSPVVVKINGRPTPDNILIAAHSYDADMRPLSSYRFRRLRVIHIEGYRKNV